MGYLFDDDITFCGNKCSEDGCFRHPSHIKNPQYPQTYSLFYGTDYCPRTKAEQNEDFGQESDGG